MMRKIISKSLIYMVASAVTINAYAALSISSKDIPSNKMWPTKYSYCKANGKGSIEISNDISPELSWSNAPAGTQSFVVLFTDPDAANVPYFNEPGHIVKPKAGRYTAYQWSLVNIPNHITSLPEGAGSNGFVRGGKKPGMTPYGLSGINAYSAAFNSPYAPRITLGNDIGKNMKGVYGQYDGPCPPWNDTIFHHYTFTVYALDVAKLALPVDGHFTGKEVLKAMQGHILAEASFSHPVATNPRLLKKLEKKYQ